MTVFEAGAGVTRSVRYSANVGSLAKPFALIGFVPASRNARRCASFGPIFIIKRYHEGFCRYRQALNSSDAEAQGGRAGIAAPLARGEGHGSGETEEFEVFPQECASARIRRMFPVSSGKRLGKPGMGWSSRAGDLVKGQITAY